MTLPHGDYTELARDYASHRAGYAPELPAVLLAGARRAAADGDALDFVDVGAGTGIWTRMVARHGCRTIAVEPNARMRELGRRSSGDLAIDWRDGSAERTGLADGSCDLLTMASSFHWTDFERATEELARVLRPGGLFAALWNTRVLETNPLLVEIEAELARLVPHLRRVSSGRSAFCEGLTERLAGCGPFDDVRYLEGRHVERMTPERYLGIWRSVNDVRVQAGEETFAAFLAYVDDRTSGRPHVDATYLTRVWTARARGGSRGAC
jgi:SAM-dependent methyltransferase